MTKSSTVMMMSLVVHATGCSFLLSYHWLADVTIRWLNDWLIDACTDRESVSSSFNLLSHSLIFILIPSDWIFFCAILSTLALHALQPLPTHHTSFCLLLSSASPFILFLFLTFFPLILFFFIPFRSTRISFTIWRSKCHTSSESQKSKRNYWTDSTGTCVCVCM